MCNWPDASAMGKLVELASRDQDQEIRRMALAALIRVAPLPDGRTPADRLQAVRTVMTLCATDKEKNALLKRTSAVRSVDALRFLLPYLDQPAHAEPACEAVVELAHHRGLREPNKSEFDQALDKVIQTSKDPTLIDRANRYKKGQTWVRPAAAN